MDIEAMANIALAPDGVFLGGGFWGFWPFGDRGFYLEKEQEQISCWPEPEDGGIKWDKNIYGLEKRKNLAVHVLEFGYWDTDSRLQVTRW